MANESTLGRTASASAGFGPMLYVAGALALLGAGVFGYMEYAERHPAQQLTLTPEGKAYVRNLKLSDVEMKATASYLSQTVVEVQGKIENAGERPLQAVEIYCLFHDSYGQLVLRKRMPIVNERMGGLKPGEAKSFRLPFDEIPTSWNQTMPQLVIAAVKF